MERVTYLRVTAHNVLTTLRCEGGSLPGAPNFSSRSQNSEKTTLPTSLCVFVYYVTEEQDKIIILYFYSLLRNLSPYSLERKISAHISEVSVAMDHNNANATNRVTDLKYFRLFMSSLLRISDLRSHL